jgi:hypothetical protein|tara:strand:- start:1711 stop:2076 length:366 start_codon:yes stop_codon:yes gene_type:complete
METELLEKRKQIRKEYSSGKTMRAICNENKNKEGYSLANVQLVISGYSNDKPLKTIGRTQARKLSMAKRWGFKTIGELRNHLKQYGLSHLMDEPSYPYKNGIGYVKKKDRKKIVVKNKRGK